MSPKKLILFLAVLAVLLAGCTTFQVTGVHVAKMLPAFSKVGDFDINVWVNEFLGSSGGANILNVTSDAMDAAIYDAIQREIQKFSGDAAVNVKIVYGADLVQMLLNGVTAGIWAPANAHVTGTIVKYNK